MNDVLCARRNMLQGSLIYLLRRKAQLEEELKQANMDIEAQSDKLEKVLDVILGAERNPTHKWIDIKEELYEC